MPLYRGAAVPFELTLIETPCDCEGELWLYLAWNKEKNRVKVRLTGQSALEPFPDVDRTLGENYFPNPFFPEPEDFEDGRYQLWLISGAGPMTTFFYNPATLDLLGSEYDFDAPPEPSIPILFPTLYLFSTPLFQPDENGDVNLEWEFPYDTAIRGDRPEFAHHIVTFPPPNLGQVNPFRLDQSTLRPYITAPFPASEARPWSDYLRGGMLFDVTVEPAEYFTEPPLTTLTATYSGATAIAGGIPKGWMFDIDAAFMNVGPPIKPFPGAAECEDFYEFHGIPPAVEPATDTAVTDGTSITTQPLDREWHCPQITITGNGARNLHLEDSVRFHPIQPGSDVVNGRMRFGVTEDLLTEDPTFALFEGFSVPYSGNVVSNGRTCFTCHRGLGDGFGLPVPPLTDSVPESDTLFTGIDADTGGDPDGLFNLDELGLIKIRPNRFDPRKSEGDPFKEVFGWRKSPKLWNIGLQPSGFLTDLRGRVMFETSRGAIFSHTQDTDNRFDDLFALGDGNDMEAFMFTEIFSHPILEILRDPSHPDYEQLISDPYATVPVETKEQKRGLEVFDKYCFSCHNAPQVFSNIDNVEPLGNGDRPPDFPSWAPAVGKAFNIGVAEWNRHNLRFTRHVGGEQFEAIVIPLAHEEGWTMHHMVRFDIGLAATTGRAADIGRFKVPQLRNLKDNAPYFHDNSAATLEEVIQYKNSNQYNRSKDGQHSPIRLNNRQMRDLLEFLKVL